MKEAGGPGRERMKRNRILTNKYLLLVAVLIAMLALSGCRTRITNNSEVSNVKYDEDGFLSETYQMRRDELGLSIAERPLLPDLGSPEEEENNEPEIDENFNVVPEEDTYVEPPTTTEARNNANNNTNTNTRRSSTSTRTPTDTPTTTYEITFNPGEGQLEGKSKGSYIVKRIPEDTEVEPPSAKREGYTLTSWKNSDGSIVVKPGGSFKVTKKDVFTAQWTKNGGETPKPEKFTVVFTDGQGNKWEQQVEKGKSARAPSVPPREGYEHVGWDKGFSNVQSNLTVNAEWKKIEIQVILDGNGKADTTSEEAVDGKLRLPTLNDILYYTFEGWNTEADGNGTAYKGGKTIEVDQNTTLYAQWKEKKGKDYWNDKVTEEVEKGTEVTFQMVGGEDSAVVQSCGAKVDTENPAFLIKIITTTDTNPWPAPDDASAWDTAYTGMDTTKNRILISKATYDSTEGKQALFKLLLLNALHGGATPIISDEQLNAAATELGINIEDIQINMRAGVPE